MLFNVRSTLSRRSESEPVPFGTARCNHSSCQTSQTLAAVELGIFKSTPSGSCTRSASSHLTVAPILRVVVAVFRSLSPLIYRRVKEPFIHSLGQLSFFLFIHFPTPSSRPESRRSIESKNTSLALLLRPVWALRKPRTLSTFVSL